MATFNIPVNDNFAEETQTNFEENSTILNDINQGSNSEKVTLTVTTFDDQNDGSSVNGLSLRDAILRAQSEPQKEYIIYLGAGTYSLFIQGNEDTIFAEAPGTVDDIVTRTGDLDIDTLITIIGVSAEATIIDASILGDRLFDVREGGYLTLNNVTIQGGTSQNTVDENGIIGGGIRVNEGGTAFINNSIIRDNSTILETDLENPNGGGIANLGFMEINNSIISENLSGDDAGGIYNTGTMKVTGSAIVGNFANAAAVEVIEAGGGGIYSFGGDLMVRNSTIAGNITGDGGGGILSEDSSTLIVNTTIANNSAQIGSGILSIGTTGDVLLQNSIVAENIDSADIEGFFAENSANNLIGNGNGLLLDGINNNRVGDILSPLDPLLVPLQNNGGITPTYALLAGSPAINAGDNSLLILNDINPEPLVTDQRGLRRISQNTVDIGSYEFIPADSLLNTPMYRFQNEDVPGTYLYAGLQESQSIKINNPQFQEEGLAFYVGVAPNDQLITLYRFQNNSLPGTYLYVGEQERQSIRQNNPNFVEEGIAFYAYGADANKGQDIYRFQNSNVPGTYLYTGAAESQSIRQNYPNFIEEGVAFEVAF